MQASKNAKAKHIALRTELLKKRNIDKESNLETWTPSKKGREMNAPWVDISRKMDVSQEFNAVFNFRNIHLMSQWVEQIPR